MISKIVKRYVWLLHTLLKYGELSFEEIKRRWAESSLYDQKDLPLRTFHEHRKAIRELFGVEIVCNLSHSKYKYSVSEPDLLRKDKLVKWLYDSFALSNDVQTSRNVMQRILFEEHPAGTKFLQPIIEAMQKGQVLEIDYQAINSHNTTYHMNPYAVKAYHQLWYVVGFLKEADAIRHLALDRMLDLHSTKETFEVPKDFDANKFYRDFVGIYVNESLTPQKVVIRAYGAQAEYLRTLPLHRSQQENVSSNGEITDFVYRVCLTPDLTTQILAMGDKVEVLEPVSLREEIKKLLQASMSRYE